MFWVGELPVLIKSQSPVVFPGPGKGRRGLGVGGMLSRSISQVSQISRPSRSQLRRSLSIVSSYSMRARVSPSGSASLKRPRRLRVVTSRDPLHQCVD